MMDLIERLATGSRLVIEEVQRDLETGITAIEKQPDFAAEILAAIEPGIPFNEGALSRNEVFEIICFAEVGNDAGKPTTESAFVEA